MEQFALFLPLALFGLGLIAYRWQKTVDRETEMLRERRSKYDCYIAARNQLIINHSAFDTEKSKPPTRAYFDARDSILIACPEEVLSAFEAHADDAGDLVQAVRAISVDAPDVTEEEFRAIVEKESESFADLLRAMRRDTFKHSTFRPNVSLVRSAIQSKR